MRGWDRHLWGIVKDGLGLLGTGWHADVSVQAAYEGEPTRPLLFTTRRDARAWCRATHAKYAAYSEGHVCRAWRFRAVRVRERIT